MNGNNDKITVRVDRYTQLCLTAVAILLTVLVIGLWSELAIAPTANAAEAFIDSSAQRKAILDAQQETNKKLDQLIELLATGQAQVQVVEKAAPAKGESNATPMRK